MKPSLTFILLFVIGLGLAGCQPATPSGPQPTATALIIHVNGQAIELVPGVNVLPEIYEAAKSPGLLENSDWILVDGYWDLMPRGVQIPLEIEEPVLESADQLPFSGFPESWVSYSLPNPGFQFDYPADWQIETLAKGVLLSAPDKSFMVQVESYPNPQKASLQVWLAERGPDFPGEILAELEDAVNGKPAVRQQVMLTGPEGQASGETIYLWMASEDWVFHWTAWPGDQPETHDLLTYMASTLR